LETAFANAVDKAGGAKVDIFVNNAGCLQPRNPLTTFDQKELEESIAGNLIGSFNAVQTIVPLLSPKAKILNTSSGLAHVNPLPGFWAYSALKLAMVKMFDYLAAENPHLSVFNIQPGVVGTDMSSIGFPDPQDAPGYDDGRPFSF
jgi:NAD(P)-dependent dehydrogenase (short-subunit alcohol dehydrogenase family)